MRRPDFITFTGIDSHTDLVRAARIATSYPVEFGVLFSPKRQGNDPRYPDRRTVDAIIAVGFPQIAAHLCGQHARNVMDGMPERLTLPACFDRIQINHALPDPARIAVAAEEWRSWGIAQTREAAFPEDERVAWLFDCSAGEGRRPDFWPHHPGGDRLVGYAGGIGPENVVEVLQQIGTAGPYWIDMESGVRTGDWLDLDKVEAVCRAVYEAAIVPA